MNGRSSETSNSYDRYHKLLGISPRDQPPTAYRLLGIDLFETDREVIDAAANKQMAYLQSCCNGQHAAGAEELLNEVSKARLQLLSPAAKVEYDDTLREIIEQQRLAEANQAHADSVPQSTNSPTLTESAVSEAAPVIHATRRGRRRGSGCLGWLLPIFVPTLISGFVAWKTGLIDFSGGDQVFQTKSSGSINSSSLDSPSVIAPETSSTQRPTAVASADPASPREIVDEGSPTFFDKSDSSPRPNNKAKAYLGSSQTDGSMSKSETRERLDSFRAMASQTDASINGGYGSPTGSPYPVDMYNGQPMRVPESELESTEHSLREILASQIRDAKSPHDKQHLATVCYQLAMDSDGAAEVYVLLKMAQENFVDGSDCFGAMLAIGSTELRFDVDLFAEKVAVLKKLVPRMFRPLDQVAAADRTETLIAVAIQREDYDAAVELSEVARKIATELRNIAMSRKFTMQRDKATLLQKVQSKIEEYRVELELDPDNAAVCEYLGRVLCFGKSDWDKGLPLLSRGENTMLAKIAALELETPSPAAELDELADQWWEMSLVSEGDTVLAKAAQERAVHWYGRSIAAGLSGLPKVAAESRLEQYRTDNADKVAAREALNKDLRDPKPPPGVPPNAIQFNGNWYLFSSKQVYFEEAVTMATRAGGRLVVVRSQAEHDFLVEHSRRPLLLGMLLRDGVWYDSLGEKQYFFLWDKASQQPDTDSGEMISAIESRSNLWHNYGKSKLYFAIEWGKE